MVDARLRIILRTGQALTVASLLAVLGACLGDSPLESDGEPICNVPGSLLFASLPPNAIPALTQPRMVDPDAPGAEYLLDTDRVLGVYIDGEARAYPHNVLWRHEIVNDQIGDTWVSVSFCPLTGSGIAFDPRLGGERLDLGVSGLLFANNLVMYDRISGQIYGPQMAIVSLCQGYEGQQLPLMSVQEMSWGRWKELHPVTTVVAEDAGGLNYRVYPYSDYDRIDNTDLLVPMVVDETRPMKERTLGVRVDIGGRAFPFGELAEVGDVVALNELIGGIPTTVFFESRDGAAALAFDARVGGQTLTFDADPSGVWIDQETGSTWRFDGEAIAGPLAGERLVTRPDSYTAFWFAWQFFQPASTTFQN